MVYDLQDGDIGHALHLRQVGQAANMKGVVSGCAVTPVSGMTVNVAAGYILYGTTKYSVSSTDITLDAAPASPNERIDVIIWDYNGGSPQVTKLTGTASDPSTNPPPAPVISTSQIALAQIRVTSDGVITSDDITDLRTYLDEVDSFKDAVEYKSNKGQANGYCELDSNAQIPLSRIPGGLDHGSLSGLGDDDHPQYYNDARHTKAVHDALGIDADTVDSKHASDLETANLQNVTASRAFDTVYQNTTGKHLLVIVAVDVYTNSEVTSYGQISSDNSTWNTQSKVHYSGSGTGYGKMGATHVLIVPNNYYYKVTGGGFSKVSWWEVEI